MDFLPGLLGPCSPLNLDLKAKQARVCCLVMLLVSSHDALEEAPGDLRGHVALLHGKKFALKENKKGKSLSLLEDKFLLCFDA
jgi:hypothetical protein